MKLYRITMKSGWDKAPCVIQIKAESYEDAIKKAKEEYHRRHNPTHIHAEEIR